MTNHPLTDETLQEYFNTLNSEFPDLPYHIYGADDMRAAADWQLEQDQKKLEDYLEDFSCRHHSADAIMDLRMFVNLFKSDMRPTTQEDN